MAIRKSLRVLNVEDSERDASLLQRHLTKAGFDLTFRRVDTPAAMSAALQTESWDVVLADYSLPEFSAMKALALLKSTGLDIPFIIISGTIGEDIAVEAMRAGASDYLMKGKLTRLTAAIERELEEAKNREAKRQAEVELARLVQELQHQRDRLNTIIAKVPGVVWEARGKPDEADQQIEFVSDYVEKMLGYTAEEWLRTPNFWLTIVHPFDRESAAKKAAVYFAEKVDGTQSFRWLRKDGSILWVESTSSTIVNEAGEPVGMRGVTVDITERRRAEATLRESEERFRRYFELGLIGMALTSLEGDILEVNDELCEILGYTRQELMWMKWDTLTHPDDLAADNLNISRVLAAECEGYKLNKRFIHKAGHFVFTTVSKKCVRRPDGVPWYFVALVQDITESRRAEEALRDSEERYRQLFESNPDPTFVFDKQTLQIVAVNQAAVQEYGYTREELLALTAKDIWRPKDVQPFLDRLSEMPYGPPRGTIWKHQRKDETTIDVEITRRPLLIGGQPAWMMIAHNVTQREILEEQFRQSQKMEAVGQLAGGMAHDFNNLLTVINGYSEFALGRLHAEDPLRNDIEQIKRAGERAAALTRQLLAFSRKQILVPSILDINSVISNLEKMLRRLIGEDITLHTYLEPKVGSIRADLGQIEQVVMNLVVNACDAMPSGGTMTIETQSIDLTESYAKEHTELKPGPHVLLAVSDTGIGMDEKTKTQIFEPFFTTKEAGKGTGLGLSTVYGIIRQSGGTIWVYSELGQGTTFKIYFPRVEKEPQSLEPVQVSQNEIRGTETILLTEDDELVRALTSEVLSAHGYTVLKAESGDVALFLCERHGGKIDLLISDVVMPKMNGPDLAARLKKMRPDMKVLFMSGYTDKAVLHQQVLDESSPFIQKPFAPPILVRKVREVLDSEKRQQH